MLKVYKTKNLEEEIGKAKIIQKGFEVTLHSGNGQYLLIKGQNMIGSFCLTSKELAVFLGQAEEFYLDADRIISFQIDEEDSFAFLHLDKNYQLIDGLPLGGGAAA